MKKTMYGGSVIVALVAGFALAALARDEMSVFDQIDLLVDIRHEIVSGYVEDPDEKEMVEAAVRGMIKSLDDPYTVFLSPEELEPFDKQVRGSFSGIGAEIDIHEDRLRIVSPLEESPAWKAGVHAGDIVLEIDGMTTKDIKITEAVRRLTGPVGTKVVILVRHESGEEAEIEITRAVINVQTVKGFRRDSDNHWDYLLDRENGVGYIRITQFTSGTAQGVREAVEELTAAGARGLILDMRFNPGGLLESAVDVSDMFLDAGQRIVSIKGRVVAERAHDATDEGTVTNLPLVVLANEGSASASEIVTGALSDNKRAKFVGRRTFGKGSVQQVRMLEGGNGAVKITNAYYYLPSGRNIHRREGEDVWGVDPDDGYHVPMTPEQVRKMISVRRDGDVLRQEGGEGSPAITPDWIESELADLQLAAGLRAVLGKIETGNWPVVGEAGADVLARSSKRANLVRQRDLITERLDEIAEELAKLDSANDGDADEKLDQPVATDDGAVERNPVAKIPRAVVPAAVNEVVVPEAVPQVQATGDDAADRAEPVDESAPVGADQADADDSSAEGPVAPPIPKVARPSAAEPVTP